MIVVAGPAQVGKTRLCKQLATQQALWRLNLDPARQEDSPNGCVSLFEPSGRPHGIRFIGALGLGHDPISVLGAVAWAQRPAGREVVCELPVEKPAPATAHLLRTIVALLRPDRLILVGEKADLLQPLNQTRVEEVGRQTNDPRPQSAVIAWRKADWRRLFFDREVQAVPLAPLRFSGTKFGSGIPLDDPRPIADLEPLHAERIRNKLYVVTNAHPPQEAIHRACDAVGCESAQLVDPSSFRGVIAGMENKLGEHFGIARVVDLDFGNGSVHLVSPAEKPLPLWRLHLGRLVLDNEGNERGHLRPWQV